jgi:hypothetical protein
MQLFQRATNILAFIFIIGNLPACKKSQTFDTAPDPGYTYSLTFSPNIAGTLTTDYNSAPGESGNGVSFKNFSDDLNHNYRYSFSTLIDRKYFNTSTNLNTSVSYNLSISFVPDSALSVKTYSYTIKSTSDVSISGHFYLKDLNGNDYGWSEFPSNVAANYATYPNCKTTIVISNIYTRKLNDGLSYSHTYADGSIDATMLGMSMTTLGGVAFENNPNYTSQLHLQYSFHGMEIKR